MPIDLHAEQAALDTGARLRLMLPVCAAVHYAHQHLVLHRDLKPSNILVGADGAPKLLNFGIAKLLDVDAPAGDSLTVDAQALFTPQYASPEQVGGGPVTTASDVHALGGVLYELLTGCAPFGRRSDGTPAALPEVLQQVAAAEPLRPSLAARQAGHAARAEQLRGDLDHIVLKALAKEPGRRYASAQALADDLQRHLDGQPVAAAAPTWRYRSGKFVRRHRVAVAASSAAVLAIAIGLGMALWQAREAQLARDAAEATLADIRTITRDLVLRFGDAVTWLPGGMKIKEELLGDALRTLDRLARDSDPALRAEVAGAYARLAELQGNDQTLTLGKPDAALVNAQKAAQLARPLLATRPTDWKLAWWTARADAVRANVMRQRGDFDAGLAALADGEAALTGVDIAHSERLASATLPAQHAALMIVRGQLLEQKAAGRGDGQAALAAFAKADALWRPLLQRRDLMDELDRTGREEETHAYPGLLSQLGVAAGGAARVLLRLERLDEAVASARTAVDFERQAVAAEPATLLHQDFLATEANHLAFVQLRRAEPEAALESALLARATADALIRAEGQDGGKWTTHGAQIDLQLGRARLELGDARAALPLLAHAAAYWDRTFAAASPGSPAWARARSGWRRRHTRCTRARWWALMRSRRRRQRMKPMRRPARWRRWPSKALSMCRARPGLQLERWIGRPAGWVPWTDAHTGCRRVSLPLMRQRGQRRWRESVRGRRKTCAGRGDSSNQAQRCGKRAGRNRHVPKSRCANAPRNRSRGALGHSPCHPSCRTGRMA